MKLAVLTYVLLNARTCIEENIQATIMTTPCTKTDMQRQAVTFSFTLTPAPRRTIFKWSETCSTVNPDASPPICVQIVPLVAFARPCTQCEAHQHMRIQAGAYCWKSFAQMHHLRAIIDKDPSEGDWQPLVQYETAQAGLLHLAQLTRLIDCMTRQGKGVTASTIAHQHTETESRLTPSSSIAWLKSQAASACQTCITKPTYLPEHACT